MRSWSIHMFSVFGIRLEVHATFLILVAVFCSVGWETDGATGVFWSLLFLAAIFTCVVLHELGHSVAAQHYGIEVIRILLLPIGGMAQFQSVPREAHKELIIAAAGPLVNFVLAGFLFMFTGPPVELLQTGWPNGWLTLFQGVLVVNLIMGLFNLLPIFPMDGGRMLRAFLTCRLSYLKATGVAAFVSKILATIGIILALFAGPPQLLLASLLAFIFIVGNIEYRMVERNETLKDFCIGDLIETDFSVIRPDESVRNALRIIEGENLGTLLLVENGSLFGMLTRGHAETLREETFLHTDPVGRHCERNISILQAEWPLELFYEMLARNKKKIFPVYRGGQLAGTIDTGNLDEKLAELGISAKRLRIPLPF